MSTMTYQLPESPYRIYRLSVWGLSFWFGIVLGLSITLGIMGGVGVF